MASPAVSVAIESAGGAGSKEGEDSGGLDTLAERHTRRAFPREGTTADSIHPCMGGLGFDKLGLINSCPNIVLVRSS